MKKIAITSLALVLAACNGGANPIDSQKFLSGLDGPKVPTVQDALVESAKNAEKQGDYKGALQFYQQALEKKPNDKEILLGMAEANRRMGQYDQAGPLYDQLLQQDPQNIAAKEGKGLLLISKGDFETPTTLFNDVLKADPKRWKTLNALGILFTTRNLYPEAQTYFKEALKYNPDSVSVLNNLGLSQALERNYDASLATLTRASTIATAGSYERKRVDLNMAAIYAISGRLDEAKTVAEKYYSGAELNNNMGLYAHLANDDEMAKAYLNMALTESKTYYPKAWENLQEISGNVPEPGDISQQDGAAPSIVRGGPSAPAQAPAPVVKQTPAAPAPAVKKPAANNALPTFPQSAIQDMNAKKAANPDTAAPNTTQEDISNIVNSGQ